MMITFRISILLAFSLVKPDVNEKPKKPKKDKGGKGAKAKPKKKDKGSKSSKSDKSKKGKKQLNKSREAIVIIKPKYLIEVGNPLGFSHIEYELLPGRPKYQIDVVCWGPVAKVFSADGELTIKTFVKNEIAWVPLSLKHVLSQIDVPELMKLYSHVVNYTIWTNKNKLGPRAKSENVKAFYIRKEDVNSEAKFVKAYDTDPNVKKESSTEEFKNYIQNIIWKCADKPGTKNPLEIVTRLEFLSDRIHRYQVNKIIETVISGKKVECKDFVPICPSPSIEEEEDKQPVKKPKKKGKKDKDSNDKTLKASKKAPKKDKASKKSSKMSSKSSKKTLKSQKGDVMLKIAIPGEVFYTDPWLSIYDLRTFSKDITHAFVLTTTKNLMQRSQKYLLNPLIIKIKKISNLPVEELINERFTAVYARYNIPHIARCSTIQKALEKDIKLNEAHAHFTDAVPKLKFLELMQTQRLYIEIHGIRETTPKFPTPNIFGTELKDNEISTRLKTTDCSIYIDIETEPTDVILAVACFDISSLLKPTWDFAEKASMHYPTNLCFQKNDVTYGDFSFIDVPTINEINLPILKKPKCCSPFSESMLIHYGTSLKIEVYLSAPFSGILEVQSNPSTYYQRLFFIVNRPEFAITLVNEILVYNQTLLGPEILIRSFLKGIKHNDSNNKDGQNLPELWTESQALTGFVLDSGHSYAFFIEGVANGFITVVWSHIMETRGEATRVFFNSEFSFEKRLYTEFLSIGGVYPVCLKVPLEKIMNQPGVYLEGNMPLPCWEALKKLSLLTKSRSLRSMIQYSLFPTTNQLRSLNYEWGVPFKWKHEDLEYAIEKTSQKIDDPVMETDLNLG